MSKFLADIAKDTKQKVQMLKYEVHSAFLSIERIYTANPAAD